MKIIKISKISFAFLLILSLLIISCSQGPRPIPTYKSPEYSFGVDEMSKQTISNVTIEVNPLSPSSLYDYPELFQYNTDNIHSKYSNGYLFYYPEDSEGRYFCYTLGTEQNIITAFKVKITNNTPHILRMKDARIYLVEGEKEPVKAVLNLGNPNLIVIDEAKNVLPKSAIDEDESIVHWVTYFEMKYAQGVKSLFKYPVGFASQVIAQNEKNYKLINDVGKEILPDFSYSGILVFPTLIDPTAQDIKLMFYDITTKTDAAGNAIEKAKFEFPLKFNQIDMYKDPVTKTWKIGTPPPQPVTEDK